MEIKKLKQRNALNAAENYRLTSFIQVELHVTDCNHGAKSVKRKELGLIILTIIAIPTLRNLHRVN